MFKHVVCRRPSPSLAISLLALFVALGGTTYAATGGNFILGMPNDASSQTSLSAPIAGKVLQVTNTSAAVGAAGIGVTVAAGKPPMVVSAGAGKATNLNADKLDGKDSTAFLLTTGKAADADKLDGLDSGNFVQGIPANPGFATPTGQTLFAREHELARSANRRSLLVVPGFATIETECTSDGFARVFVLNTSGQGVTVIWSQIGPTIGESLLLESFIPAGGESQLVSLGTSGTIVELRVQVALGENSPTGQRLFSADIFALNAADECVFQGTGLMQTT